MIKVVTKRALEKIQNGSSKIPAQPVLLANQNPKTQLEALSQHTETNESITTINGKTYHLKNAGDKTLLRLIREDAGLIGTKEGCDEGECGACTVILDDQAVMSCMVPAERAHNAVITTVEGFSKEDEIHPVQQAFLDEGAVQCGYCTPGFIMSAVKLLEEKPTPTQLEIKQAISGNLCRCTGYFKIISAIEKAAKK
jgi:carbon-monoxide dehydrogenase medium subunit